MHNTIEEIRDGLEELLQSLSFSTQEKIDGFRELQTIIEDYISECQAELNEEEDE